MNNKRKAGRQATSGAGTTLAAATTPPSGSRTVVHPVGVVGISIFIAVFFILFGVLN